MIIQIIGEGLVLEITGCASAKVDVLTKVSPDVVKPDFVLVYMAVTTDGLNRKHSTNSIHFSDNSLD